VRGNSGRNTVDVSRRHQRSPDQNARPFYTVTGLAIKAETCAQSEGKSLLPRCRKNH
jgi:hypothetical protein